MCTRCSSGSHAAMTRRDFLRLGGVGLAGATLLAATGTGNVLARPGSSLAKEFENAARTYDVPVELLLAVGYVNTRWEMPPPALGDYEPGDIHGRGGYGIMGLRRDPTADTLGAASELTGIPEGKLTTDRKSNIRGGAAVLAGGVDVFEPVDINGYYDAVAEYGGSPLYANQVYEVLQGGATATTLGGESLSLPAQEGAEPGRLVTTQAAGDYPNSTFYGAASGNYTAANRPYSHRINKIVIHVAQGSWSGTLDWFRNPRSGVSAHYTVSSRYGAVGQSVRERNIAYHAGNWPVNQTSVGIEHEGYFNNPSYFTDAMYRSSAKLSAYLSRRYGIPVSRRNILGHGQVASTPCPGRVWNWNKYMNLVRYYR